MNKFINYVKQEPGLPLFIAVWVVCLLLVTSRAWCYSSQTIGILGIGESTSCGAVYNYNSTPPIYTGLTTDMVPNKVAATLSTSTYPVTIDNRAMSGTRIEWNFENSTRPGMPNVLAEAKSRIVLIYTGGNNALWTSVSYAGGYAVPLSTALTNFDTNLRLLVSRIRHAGKIPFIVSGADFTSQTLNANWVYSEYSPALSGFLSIQNQVVSDTGALRDSSTRLCSVYQNDGTSCAGSSDGIHYTSAGYTKIAARISNVLRPKMTEIRNAEITSRWYAMVLNGGASSSWLAYWNGRINTLGIDAAAEECYTFSGLTEAQWIQNVLTNMGLDSTLYSTCYAQMNTYSTYKHGKILNWMLDVMMNNTETSGIYYQARCCIQNKTSVAFAWGYVFNHNTDLTSLSTVTYNFSTVATATAGF